MLLKITNITNSIISISAVRISVAPNSLRSVSIPDSEDQSFTKRLSDELTALRDAGHITFSTEEDPDIDDILESPFIQTLDGVYKIRMDDAPNVTGGGTTAQVGFQLINLADVLVSVNDLIQFAVFDDADLSIPATNATLNTASKGIIIAGAGTAALKVRTDTTGKFTCTLTNLIDEIVYLGCSSAFGGPALVCRETDIVEFSI